MSNVDHDSVFRIHRVCDVEDWSAVLVGEAESEWMFNCLLALAESDAGWDRSITWAMAFSTGVVIPKRRNTFKPVLVVRQNTDNVSFVITNSKRRVVGGDLSAIQSYEVKIPRRLDIEDVHQCQHLVQYSSALSRLRPRF